MKINIIQLFLFAGITTFSFSGCDNSSTGLVYLNDMDVSAVWTDNPSANLIVSNNPHSGRYVCKLDTVSACSPTFYKQEKNLSEAPLQTAEVEGWVLMSNIDCSPWVILDIRDTNEKPIGYDAQHVKATADDMGKWVHFSFTFDLTQKNRNASDNYLRIYVMNNKKESVLLDDLKISFE